MTQTARLGLPLLAAGQAQKELTHNDALALLDLAVQLVVERSDLTVPPGSPVPGECWIVASGASGAWVDMDGAIAGWTDHGWLFALPRTGWRAWNVAQTHTIRFDGTGWVSDTAREDGFYVAGDRVVGPRQGAISAPAGGATQDAEARSTIDSMLAVLRMHGLIDV